MSFPSISASVLRRARVRLRFFTHGDGYTLLARVAEEEEEMMQVADSRLSPEEAANATKEAVRDATVEGAKEGARKAAREGRLPGQVRASREQGCRIASVVPLCALLRGERVE